MINEILNSSTLPMLEQVVGFTQARHNVLAGNIANLDTPGYRASDLSPDLFTQHLHEMVESRKNGTTDPNSPLQDASGGSKNAPYATHSWDTILRHDDNNTSLEHQVTEMSKNQMQHNMAVSIMVSQFRLLQTAISERV
jgi:flagellar basal-body rod protein FlgB